MAATPPGIFVTGTDTDVGKTYVASQIARSLTASALRVGVYKPVASGCRSGTDSDAVLISDDAVQLWQAAGCPGRLEDICPQRFHAPLAPHVAAAKEGRSIDEELLTAGLEKWSDCEVVIVEGAGGLRSPLSPHRDNLDVACELGLALLVVAANRLGVLNHTLLTLDVAASRGLPVVGVVLNDVPAGGDASSSTNLAELRSRCEVPVLTHLLHGHVEFTPAVDWCDVVRRL
jgi:dethiobiotin synthetase